MAVPGSGGEIQAPRFVCDSCGALFHHVPEACTVCGGKIRARDRFGAAADPARDRKRLRILYAVVGCWVLLLGAIVTYTAIDDPTLGHAGHMVYPNERALENFRRGGPADLSNANRPFRLMKSDRIERLTGTRVASNGAAGSDEVWIRVTSGPHAGRSGVIVW